MVPSLTARLLDATNASCCWSAWGGPCTGKVGSGGRCNSNWTISCNANSDRPPLPSPPPAPPHPEGPPYRGFWYGWVGSHSSQPAPSAGWFFSFPGLTVSPPFTPKDGGSIPPPPMWGSYDKKILTQGGGDTSWGNGLYGHLKGQLANYTAGGWDGVCWDWEKTSADHTSAGFNGLMRATKAAGLLNIVTSTYAPQGSNQRCPRGCVR